MGGNRKRKMGNRKQKPFNKHSKRFKEDTNTRRKDEEMKKKRAAEIEAAKVSSESDTESESEDEMTPLEQLMATFGKKKRKQTAYTSSESDSEEETPNKIVRTKKKSDETDFENDDEDDDIDSEDDENDSEDDENDSEDDDIVFEDDGIVFEDDGIVFEDEHVDSKKISSNNNHIESEDSDEELANDVKGIDYFSEHFDHVLKKGEATDILKGTRRCVHRRQNIPAFQTEGDFISNDGSSAPVAPNSVQPSTNVPIDNRLYSLISTYTSAVLSGFRGADSQADHDALRINTCCYHVVQHVLRSRAKILHHNAKLKQNRGTEVEYRDRGLIRPRVLVLLPFRSSALRYVKAISGILGESAVVMDKKRFYTNFSSQEEPGEEEKRLKRKPEDYQKLFGGNTDDNFMLKLAIKKKCLKLYTKLYDCDVIVGSPLAVKLKAVDNADFLSSIEVLVIDQADVLMMQNWEHMFDIIDRINKLPKSGHDVDFSRVRSWALEADWAKCYRQTIAFSSVMFRHHYSIVSKNCFNFKGIVDCNFNTEVDIVNVGVSMSHTFQKFRASSLIDEADERLKFFTEEVLPQHNSALMYGTLIFIPSYFDYVRLRNYLRKNDINFAQISEYHEADKIAEARDKFFHRHRKFLLYTERAHFNHRFKIKGIRHLLFYQLPMNPHFYSEMCNLALLTKSTKKAATVDPTSSILISRYDNNQLIACLGLDRAASLQNSSCKTHRLVTQ